MSDWKTYKLDDLGEILNSKRVPLNSRERENKKGIFPYYGASGIVDYIDGYIFEGEHVLISEDGENLRSRQTPIAFKANGKFWVNNHAHIFRGREDWINNFVVYYFQNSDLSPYITGAAQPKLNKENLLRIPIKFRNDEYAKEIASILSSLDEKIELNLQMNQTLEAMAQAIFKEWFVNFNFPGFDGEFVDGLPKGWRMGKLNEVITFIKGKKPDDVSVEKQEGYLPQILIDTFNTGNSVFANPNKMVIASQEEMLMVMDGASSGRIEIGHSGIVGSTIAKINLKNEFTHPLFIYFFLKTKEIDIMGNTTGSSIPHADKNKILDYDFVIPKSETLHYFEKNAISVLEKIKTNKSQIRTLTQIRDSLLPKLMTGKIEVKE